MPIGRSKASQLHTHTAHAFTAFCFRQEIGQTCVPRKKHHTPKLVWNREAFEDCRILYVTVSTLEQRCITILVGCVGIDNAVRVSYFTVRYIAQSPASRIQRENAGVSPGNYPVCCPRDIFADMINTVVVLGNRTRWKRRHSHIPPATISLARISEHP